MAGQISLGVDSNPACEAVVRSLPEVSANTEQPVAAIPDTGVPYAEIADLEDCAGSLSEAQGILATWRPH